MSKIHFISPKIRMITIVIFSFLGIASANATSCNPGDQESLPDCLNTVMSQVSRVNGTGSAKICDSKTAEGRSLPALSSVFTKSGADCTNFISNQQSSGSTAWRDLYGPWGKIIVDYLDEEGLDSVFFSDNINGITEVCPNWNYITPVQKEHVWVWIFAAIAHKESTCKEGARNGKATNGVATGLLQLDERLSGRSFRGPHCSEPRSVTPAEENLSCGLDIMKGLLTGQYKGTQKIWGRGNNSYWEEIRKPGGGIVGDFVRSHPLCGSKIYDSSHDPDEQTSHRSHKKKRHHRRNR
jgi:hypothetical protein